MRRNTANLIISGLTLVFILLLIIAGWLVLTNLPSRQLSRLPKFVQTWVIPEPDSALLPTVAFSADEAAALLGSNATDTPQVGSILASVTQTPITPPTATPIPEPSQTPTLVPIAVNTVIPTPTLIPSPTPNGLPAAYRQTNITYHQQDWNNCGPATLAMALSALGTEITQYDTASFLKPNPEDRNVSPYQMAQYVNQSTGFQAAARINGSLELLRTLLANDFPVILEVGDRAPTEVSWVDSEPDVAYRDWWGHYLLAAGYDDAIDELWVYNSLIWDIASETNTSSGHPYSYTDLLTFWPQFNSSYVVLYTPEREDELNMILGESVDPQIMWQQALEKNQLALQNRQEDPFLWFNLGSSYTRLGQYEQAVTAFDKARSIGLPWRMLWYQFELYEAYYEMGRYDDIILLANATLNGRPYFEESFYWRGQAYAALGNDANARNDYQAAVNFQPYFQPAVDALQHLDS